MSALRKARRAAATAVGSGSLIGTTGELPIDAIEAYAQKAPVAIVPNFSVGVPALIDLVKQLVPTLPPDWDIEVVEAHHNQKKTPLLEPPKDS